jgi:hypothetical protein
MMRKDRLAASHYIVRIGLSEAVLAALVSWSMCRGQPLGGVAVTRGGHSVTYLRRR